jgi:transcriptional regulator GlxA family with amidase domain
MTRQELLASAAGAAATTLAPPARASEASALKTPKSGPISVAFVAGEGANVIDIAGAWEVFQDTMVPERGSSEEDQMPFRAAIVSDTTKPFHATNGLVMTPSYSFDRAPQPNIVVMGAQGEHTPRKIAWIREAAQKADVVMSVCTGAFLLAETGLLDGLRATTHHDYYDRFEKKFPNVTLVRGPRYVENKNGAICTAGGLTSGIELALRIVNRYFGDPVAARTAYYMEYKRSPERPTAVS